ncbi:RNA dependent RNA polymerase-domain-containing protein [Mycena floridula]|nr:RNA dependent RNA polymerase-domain-containing protein [Mycena floridula]
MPSWKRPLARPFVVRSLELYHPRCLEALAKWYTKLPLPVALQCERLIHSNSLTPLELLNLHPLIHGLVQDHGAALAGKVLENFVFLLSQHDLIKNSPRRQDLTTALRNATRSAKKQAEVKKKVAIDPDLALCYQLYLTPTTYILEGPYPDKSNRVLRAYPEFHHHFIRVTFTDEGGQGRPLRRPHVCDFNHDKFIQAHVGDVLKRGFEFAGQRWEWLAYSQSALKEAQMLFMSPFTMSDGSLVDGDRIRSELGNFDAVIHQPAKYGARIAQTFSATQSSIRIPKEQTEEIDDSYDESGQYMFTDGAGDMSSQMARDIWNALGRKHHRTAPPSAFQARYGGCKGVWMVNSELIGKVLRIRPSQKKFESDSDSFDVASTSRHPGVTYLNQALVKRLKDSGIPSEIFLALQKRPVNGLEIALTGFSHAATVFANNRLATHFRGSAILSNLREMLGIDFDSSPKDNIDFFKRATMVGITHCLREIKFRARILVEGPALMGVCDAWNILEEGQIYANYNSVNQRGNVALEGRVLVTRSPIIHPGDIQFATAIGSVDPSSPLFQLVNVVVFSSKGKRPLPSMLGGGDLDGDLFNIITDKNLHPPRADAAGNYAAGKKKVLDQPSTMTDVANFVVYDRVGIISTRHLLIADQSDKNSDDARCMKLTTLASHAVDFVKSGVAVPRQEIPFADSRVYKPDFLAKEYDLSYPSQKALGKMFREVPVRFFKL